MSLKLYQLNVFIKSIGYNTFSVRYNKSFIECMSIFLNQLFHPHCAIMCIDLHMRNEIRLCMPITLTQFKSKYTNLEKHISFKLSADQHTLCRAEKKQLVP